MCTLTKITGTNTPKTIFAVLVSKNGFAFFNQSKTFLKIIEYKITSGIQKRRRYTEAKQFSGIAKEQSPLYVIPFSKFIEHLVYRRRKLSDEHARLLA